MSPSLTSDSPLDLKLKSSLVSDMFNLIGIRKFDRKKESMNKIKHRMKGLYARGKSLNTRYTYNFSYQNGKPNTTDTYSTHSFTTSLAPHHLHQELSAILKCKFCNLNPNLADPSLQGHKKLVEVLITLKHKETLRECIAEYGRRGNFSRIYPAKGTNRYDKYFKSYRPYNNFLYKCLFTNDVIPEKIEEKYTPIIKPLNSVGQIYSVNTNDLNSTRGNKSANDSEADKSRKRPQTVNSTSVKAVRDKENSQDRSKVCEH